MGYQFRYGQQEKLLYQTDDGGSNPSLPANLLWAGRLVFRIAVPKGEKKPYLVLYAVEAMMDRHPAFTRIWSEFDSRQLHQFNAIVAQMICRTRVAIVMQ